MKKIRVTVILIITAICFMIVLGKSVLATGQAKLSIAAYTDESKLETKREVYLTLKLINFANVDVNEPMALTAQLSYEKAIFESVSIEKNTNGWVAQLSESNKILLDTSSIEEGKDIAKLKFVVKDGVGDLNTRIELNSISVTNGENVNMDELNLSCRVRSGRYLEDNSGDDDDGNVVTGNQVEAPMAGRNEVGGNLISNEIHNQITDNQGEDDERNPGAQQNIVGDGNEGTKVEKIEKVKDLTTSDKEIPQTGNKGEIWIGMICLCILGLIAFVRYKKIEK